MHRRAPGFTPATLFLPEARFSIRSSKHVIAPQGVAGGKDGQTGNLTVNPGTSEEKHLPTRYADYPLKAGDVFRLETPGGGGLGDPFERDAEAVLNDVIQGYVSIEKAASDYGVALVETAREGQIDLEATMHLRAARRGKGLE